MKAVILAGGLGTRISEESNLKPKPMIEIGGRPILWHIMKIYSHYGINDFIICCGYKGNYIKEYFSNYFLFSSDVTIDLKKNEIELHNKSTEPWRVTLVDTGEKTQTGGRLKRIKKFLKNEKFFCFTYGDGLSNLNIRKSINFHIKHKKLATLAAVYAQGRFGALKLKKNKIVNFEEKKLGDGFSINGGFFVLSPKVIDFIKGDETVWEKGPLQRLSKTSQLMAFKHKGFWQPMDTLRDKRVLEKYWQSQSAPWKVWKE